jgi:dTDP-D-glucose 4,6-dehydratase
MKGPASIATSQALAAPATAELAAAPILVTGGAGFIGSNLVRSLVRSGRHVVNLDLLTYAGNLQSLADVADAPNYRFVHADLRDAATIDEIVGAVAADAILHLAAESRVEQSRGDCNKIAPNIDLMVCCRT